MQIGMVRCEVQVSVGAIVVNVIAGSRWRGLVLIVVIVVVLGRIGVLKWLGLEVGAVRRCFAVRSYRMWTG